MSDVITSSQNTYLKLVRSLQRRRTRDEEHAFVVEGEDLVLAGLETGAAPRVLLVDAERMPELDAALVTCPVLLVDPKVLGQVSAMAHPPRVIGIFELPPPLDIAIAMDARARAGTFGPWIALDALADPGNVGTALRTAAALGAGGVVVLPGTADPFGAKAARASMGAIFRVPLVRMDDTSLNIADELDALRAAIPALSIVALDSGGDVALWDTPLDATSLIIIGSERTGISSAAQSRVDLVAQIPQDAAVESVNAGVAASIALYEWRRRQTDASS